VWFGVLLFSLSVTLLQSNARRSRISLAHILSRGHLEPARLSERMV
jgi:hypothetical protein